MRLTFTAIFLSYWWRLNLLVYFLMTLGLDRGCTILLLQASVVVFKTILTTSARRSGVRQYSYRLCEIKADISVYFDSDLSMGCRILSSHLLLLSGPARPRANERERELGRGGQKLISQHWGLQTLSARLRTLYTCRVIPAPLKATAHQTSRNDFQNAFTVCNEGIGKQTADSISVSCAHSVCSGTKSSNKNNFAATR